MGFEVIFVSFHGILHGSSNQLLDVLCSFVFCSCHGKLFRLIFGREGRAMKADILPKVQCLDHVYKYSLQIVVYQGMLWGSVLEDFLGPVGKMHVRQVEVDDLRDRPL